MTINKQKIYIDYISKLEKALIEDDFDSIDYILEFMYTSWISQEILETLDSILSEATLYVELKEQEYKDEALKLIWEFKS